MNNMTTIFVIIAIIIVIIILIILWYMRYIADNSPSISWNKYERELNQKLEHNNEKIKK
jgi:uncharacterized protein HemY